MRSNHQYNKFSFIIPFSDASVTSFQVYGFHNCNQQSVLQHVHYFQDDIWAQLLHKLHRLQSKNYNDHKSYRNTFPQNAAHNVSPLDLTKEEMHALLYGLDPGILPKSNLQSQSVILRPSVQYGYYCTLLNQSDSSILYVSHS